MPKWNSIFFFWHSTNYSKRHTTVVLRIDTAKHDQMSQKCKIEMSLDVSNWFFLNWLFSRGFGKKKNFFTELERRVKQRNSLFKKHSLFKTQVISFFKLKHIKSEGVSVMWNLFLYVFSKMWKGKYPSCLQKYYRLKLFLLLSLSRCKIGRNGQ